jgi:hypothetical protein
MPNRININSIEEFNRLTGTTYDASLKNYNFEDYEFTIELNLKEANYFNFKNCVFKEDVKFPYRTHRDSSLAESTFEKKANFDNTSFEDNIRFYETKFKGETSFNNTKFKKLADFWNAKFENILFSYSLIDKLAIFRGTIFEKGFDFSLAIIPGELSIFDIKVDIKAFKDVKDTDNVIEFAENVSENGVITRKNKSQRIRTK